MVVVDVVRRVREIGVWVYEWCTWLYLWCGIEGVRDGDEIEARLFGEGVDCIFSDE
jgi:hypothetical protein